MDKAQKHDPFMSDTPSSEPFMIDYLLHHLLTEMPGLKGIRFKLRFSGAS
jgi:hypothetical protein